MTFTPRAGAERDLMRQPELLRALQRFGVEVQREAERIAPRQAELPPERRRHYADMFDTTVGHDSEGAVAAVSNRHFIALFVEFGTVHNKPHAVLRRALDTTKGRL